MYSAFLVLLPPSPLPPFDINIHRKRKVEEGVHNAGHAAAAAAPNDDEQPRSPAFTYLAHLSRVVAGTRSNTCWLILALLRQTESGD